LVLGNPMAEAIVLAGLLIMAVSTQKHLRQNCSRDSS